VRGTDGTGFSPSWGSVSVRVTEETLGELLDDGTTPIATSYRLCTGVNKREAAIPAAIVSSSAIITRLTPDFFVAEWFNVRTIPENLTGVQTCAPVGLVSIAPTDDKNQSLSLYAENWAGDGCVGWSIPSGHRMMIPLLPNATFNDVPAEMTNDVGVIQVLNNLTYWYNFSSNNTQQVMFDMTLDYLHFDENAQNVTILLSWNNGAGILKVAGLAIAGLLAIVAF